MTEQNPVIRIVDDDPHIHDAVGFVLEGEGYALRHYYSAEDFLTGDLISDPGCAVVDVRMSGMSGIVLFQTMRERGIRLPILFLSAHGDVDMAVDAIESGAVTFLTKPVRTEKLLEAIEKALAKEKSVQNGTFDTAGLRAAYEKLSDRERQVVLLAVNGLPNRRIAERLGIVVRTVEFHRAGAMRKLGCHNATELKAALEAIGVG